MNQDHSRTDFFRVCLVVLMASLAAPLQTVAQSSGEVELSQAMSALTANASGLDEGTGSAGEPGMLYACYIPRLGLVYRIKAEGLRNRCHANRHVEFSWSEMGGEGTPGPAGPHPIPRSDRRRPAGRGIRVTAWRDLLP